MIIEAENLKYPYKVIEAENLKYPCKVIGLQSTEARNLRRVKECEYYYYEHCHHRGQELIPTVLKDIFLWTMNSRQIKIISV